MARAYLAAVAGRGGPIQSARLALPSLLEGGAQKHKTVVAEVHVITIQIDGWRSETTAADQLVGIRPQLVLDALLGNTGKKARLIGTNGGANVGQDLALEMSRSSLQ